MGQMRLPHYAGIGLLMLLFAAGSIAAENDKPRLKFRSKGPVCMCATGLGEKDISRGMARTRLEQLQRAAPESTQQQEEKDSPQPTRRDADEDRQ